MNDEKVGSLTRVNIKEHIITSNMRTGLENKFNELQQKMNCITNNNFEMQKLYESEENRLKKSNELFFSQTEKGREKQILDLEKTANNLRNDCDNLRALIEEKELYFQFLVAGINDEAEEKNYNENNIENEATDEELQTLIEQMKTDFENKILLKQQELQEYYKRKNGYKTTIIEPPPPFVPKSLSKESEFIPKNINNFEVHTINYNQGLSLTDINLISSLIAVQCLKEEYPKEFFLDYVFDEIEFKNKNQEINLNVTNYNSNEETNQKNFLVKNNFHNAMAISNEKVAEKIAKLFDFNWDDDIKMILKYLEYISRKNKNILKMSLDMELTGFRYRKFEEMEKGAYNKELKNLLANIKDELIELGKNHDDVIHITELNYLLKKSNVVMMSDLYYYLLSLMKISKKDRFTHKDNLNLVKPMHIYELYLKPLIEIFISDKQE